MQTQNNNYKIVLQLIHGQFDSYEAKTSHGTIGVALWTILVAVKSGIGAVMLSAVGVLVFMSHAALFQLWLCNIDVCIISSL